MEGFTAHQATKFTGCSARQLRYWDQIDLVNPSIQGTGGRPGGAEAVLVPRSRRAEGRQIPARQRDVAPARPQGLGLPEPPGRARQAPVRGQAHHRRGEHLQDRADERRDHRRPCARASWPSSSRSTTSRAGWRARSVSSTRTAIGFVRALREAAAASADRPLTLRYSARPVRPDDPTDQARRPCGAPGSPGGRPRPRPSASSGSVPAPRTPRASPGS